MEQCALLERPIRQRQVPLAVLVSIETSDDKEEKDKSAGQVFTREHSGNVLSRIGCGWVVHAALQTPRRFSMLEGIFQPMHLLVVFGIALLVFGPKKLPELGKGIGEGIRGLKSAMKDHEEPSDKITDQASDSSRQ